MLPTSFHLLNFRHLDSSCYLDKVSRAAGRRSVGSVFCSPLRKCTVIRNFLAVYRDSYVIELYRDGTTSHRLPGLAKNSPTLTQTATSYTTGPLGCNNIFRAICPLAPGKVCGRGVGKLVKWHQDF